VNALGEGGDGRDKQQDGGVVGLQLVVGSSLVQDMVPVAEIDTQRLDFFYGTFRASMKVTDVPGTCAAFFWVSWVQSFWQ
jgi:hypothetical protein